MEEHIHVDFFPFTVMALGDKKTVHPMLHEIISEGWLLPHQISDEQRDFYDYCWRINRAEEKCREAEKLILAVNHGGKDHARAKEALSELIHIGWPSLYRHIHSHHSPVSFDEFWLEKGGKRISLGVPQQGPAQSRSERRILKKFDCTFGTPGAKIPAPQSKGTPVSFSNGDFCIFMTEAMNEGKTINDGSMLFDMMIHVCAEGVKRLHADYEHLQ